MLVSSSVPGNTTCVDYAIRLQGLGEAIPWVRVDKPGPSIQGADLWRDSRPHRRPVGDSGPLPSLWPGLFGTKVRRHRPPEVPRLRRRVTSPRGPGRGSGCGLGAAGSSRLSLRPVSGSAWPGGIAPDRYAGGRTRTTPFDPAQRASVGSTEASDGRLARFGRIDRSLPDGRGSPFPPTAPGTNSR